MFHLFILSTISLHYKSFPQHLSLQSPNPFMSNIFSNLSFYSLQNTIPPHITYPFQTWVLLSKYPVTQWVSKRYLLDVLILLFDLTQLLSKWSEWHCLRRSSRLELIKEECDVFYRHYIGIALRGIMTLMKSKLCLKDTFGLTTVSGDGLVLWHWRRWRWLWAITCI